MTIIQQCMGEDRRCNVKELAEHTGNVGAAPWSRVLLEKLTGLQLVKKSPTFLEPESSSPHSQVPASCPYPKPARSSPYRYITLLEIHLTIILPSTSGSPKWSLSLRFFPPKPCISLSSSPYALRTPPISYLSILSSEQYWMSTDQ